MKYFLLLITFCSSNLFAQSFEKIDNTVTSSSLGSRAATFADIDNDGWLDLYITNGKKGGQNNELFMNDGAGGFELKTSVISQDNSPSDGATWGDIDNDGDLDLFVVTWYGKDNYFYKNDNGTLKASQAISSNGFSETASWADFDQDGYLDLFVTNSSDNVDGSKNELISNQGDGKFARNTNLSITDSRKNSRSVNWIDVDNDNDLDLFVSNEKSANKLYFNVNGEFEVSTTSGLVNSRNSTGSSWADYDNDGDLDLFVANYGDPNELYQNEGAGIFTSVQVSTFGGNSNSSFGSVWGDLDNDGDLDLYVANGFKSGQQLKNNLYWNQGDGTFTEVTDHILVNSPGWSFGAAVGDYDNDGFLDLLVANCFDEAQNNGLYHNSGNNNNWLILDLEGVASNKSAIGAKVKVTALLNGVSKTQLREISSQSGYNGQNSLRAHFGLADATLIEKIEIIWPLGNSEIIDHTEVNQIVNVRETVPSDFVRANFKLTNNFYLVSSPFQITDLSVYSENESATYEWDFDNDGVIDSNDKNPNFQIDEVGDYTVQLTVTIGEISDVQTRIAYLKIRETVLSVNDSNPINHMAVYPNPTSNKISIKVDFKIAQIQIHALDGRIVFEKNEIILAKKEVSIENLKFPQGQYIITVSDGRGNKEVQKLIKE